MEYETNIKWPDITLDLLSCVWNIPAFRIDILLLTLEKFNIRPFMIHIFSQRKFLARKINIQIKYSNCMSTKLGNVLTCKWKLNIIFTFPFILSNYVLRFFSLYKSKMYRHCRQQQVMQFIFLVMNGTKHFCLKTANSKTNIFSNKIWAEKIV
jgi:hypothetical protein